MRLDARAAQVRGQASPYGPSADHGDGEVTCLHLVPFPGPMGMDTASADTPRLFRWSSSCSCWRGDQVGDALPAAVRAELGVVRRHEHDAEHPGIACPRAGRRSPAPARPAVDRARASTIAPSHSRASGSTPLGRSSGPLSTSTMSLRSAACASTSRIAPRPSSASGSATARAARQRRVRHRRPRLKFAAPVDRPGEEVHLGDLALRLLWPVSTALSPPGSSDSPARSACRDDESASISITRRPSMPSACASPSARRQRPPRALAGESMIARLRSAQAS